MSLNKLQRTFEERRINLVETLQKGKGELELSKQHQLYGAIKEIEKFLEAIEYHRDQAINGTDFELKREGPRPLSTRAGTALQAAGSKTKGAIGSVVYGIYDKMILGTGRGIKRTKRRIRLYREVAREVKERSKGDKQN